MDGRALSVQGRLLPFAEHLRTEFDVVTDEVDLTQYREYLAAFTPLRLESGRLGVNLKLVVEQPAVMLGACNLATLAVLWAVFRFWAARRYGANFLQTTVHFLEIFLVWGLFQIGCLVGLELSGPKP